MKGDLRSFFLPTTLACSLPVGTSLTRIIDEASTANSGSGRRGDKASGLPRLLSPDSSFLPPLTGAFAHPRRNSHG